MAFTQDEATSWTLRVDFLHAYSDEALHWLPLAGPGERDLARILFGGDRLDAVRQGWAVAVMEVDRLVALATCSMEGEMGRGPSVVGLMVSHDRRRRGLGRLVMEEAARILIGYGAERILYDAVTPAGRATAESVRRAIPQLEVRG